ncbi:MAG: alpha/beta hydrolase, partial [Clostridiales bacterium]|nr:alpha/beta hydrolase [Clostridiales bacterium]
MIDYIRENLSYYPIYYRLLFKTKKDVTPEYVSYGSDKEQYFLYYEPKQPVSDKVVIWVHGGGWNAGNPKFFDYVGQNMAGAGYRFVSIGYRLSPKNRYPAQIEDVCAAYNAAIKYLKDKGIDTTKIILSGPSAGAHLSSILCYSKKIQKKYNVDISGVISYAGFGGPY